MISMKKHLQDSSFNRDQHTLRVSCPAIVLLIPPDVSLTINTTLDLI